MCGLFTSYSPDGPVDPGLFLRGLAAIDNRGPDARTYHSADEGRLMMGHTLLSISPKKIGDGQQPMRLGSLVLTFNGEVYNHRQVRADLERSGSTISGDCDTTLMLHGLSRDGLPFLNTLNACYAFVLFDERSQRLFFGRDRYGEKQLVYRHTREGQLDVASEAKALFRAERCPAKINEDRLFSDLIFDFFSDRGETYFAGIKNCEPGSVNTFDLATQSCGQVFKVSDYRKQTPHFDLLTSMKHAVYETVPENRPFAVVLSGGFDSSAIATLVPRVTNRDFQTVTIKHNGTSSEDSQFARIISADIGSEHHHEIVIDTQDSLEALRPVSVCLEEPLLDQVYLAQYRIYKTLHDLGIRVALNGQSADEFWRGYVHHYAYQEREAAITEGRLDQYFREIANARGLGEFLSQKDIDRLIQRNLEGVPIDPNAPQQTTFHLAVNRHLQAMLTHEDRLSMASSVEVRLPFLHRYVVEHALGINETQKVVCDLEKYPIREAMAGYMEDKIRLRSKQAFPDAPDHLYQTLVDELTRETSGTMFSRDTIEKSEMTASQKWRLLAYNLFADTTHQLGVH